MDYETATLAGRQSHNHNSRKSEMPHRVAGRSDGIFERKWPGVMRCALFCSALATGGLAFPARAEIFP
ncbi:MAG TPA: hypothetical protein VHA37_06330, partial [Candidatus Saccharimonadales bacterium]|nr:hypothetical protein [Candidatus Saccharimonadales bacterium]